MAAILAGNNVEEEYLWSCTLSGSNKEYTWEPSSLEPEKNEEEQEGPKVKPGHRLLIKTAILMPNAKKDEVTVVQIDGEGYNKQKVTVPIVAMKGGEDLQKFVDLLVPGPAKIKIIHGEGPINLVGSHCVDYYGFKDDSDDSDDDDEDEDTENEEMETEQEPAEDAKKANKSGDTKASPAKGKSSPADKKKEEEKKATPEKKTTPSKDDSKKRKASADPKSAEKKAKN